MYKSKQKRRALVILLMTIGGVFIFLATDAWFGYLLVVVGIIIELIGIRLDHHR